MRVENARLMVRDGLEYERSKPNEYKLKPKCEDYDNIVIYGHSGNISLEALKWLSKLNWDGQLLNSVLIPEPKNGASRFHQYQAFSDERRIDIAKKFIEAKIKSSVLVLDWIVQRHPELKETKKQCFDEHFLFKDKLPEADTISKIRGLEGMFARNHWLILAETFNKKLEFEGRLFGKTGRPMAAFFTRA